MPSIEYIEKTTVSASIAHITDGADRVPVKAWGVTLGASLTGFSSLNCAVSGKNLMSPPTYSASTDSLCLDFGKDMTVTSLTFSFLATNSEVDNITSAIVDFRKADGTHYYRTLNDFKDSNNVSFSASQANNGVFKYVGSNLTFRYLYVSYTSNTRSKFTSDSLSNWQLELGSTASDYTPYVATTVSTVNLGRTIYGGSVDVIAGTGTKTYEKVLGSELEWSRHSSGYFYSATTKDTKASGQTNVIAEDLTTTTTSAMTTTDYSISGRNTDGQIYIRLTGTETKEQFETWIANKVIVFELATPTDFTFTPITPTPETALGVNNFWSDGDSQVTYYAQAEAQEAYSIEGETLVDIADAIRGKTGGNTPIDVSDFADEIDTLSSPVRIDDLIPTKPSANTNVVTSSVESGSEGYYAFDTSANEWESSATPAYIGYHFDYPVICNRYKICITDTTKTPITWTLEGSNDGTNWVVIDRCGCVWDTVANEQEFIRTFYNETQYSYLRLNWQTRTGTSVAVQYIEFDNINTQIEPQGVVDLIPSVVGESAFCSGQTGNWAPSGAFDNSTTSAWLSNTLTWPLASGTECYVGYKTGSAICNRIYIKGHRDVATTTLPVDYYIEGSNDNGTTWTQLVRVQKRITSANDSYFVDFNNDTAYSQYRMNITEVMGGNGSRQACVAIWHLYHVIR